jgi:hypothetical protein
MDISAETLVDEAHHSGRKVATHTVGPESMKYAVEARVDSLEHRGGPTKKLAAELMRNIYYSQSSASLPSHRNSGDMFQPPARSSSICVPTPNGVCR